MEEGWNMNITDEFNTSWINVLVGVCWSGSTCMCPDLCALGVNLTLLVMEVILFGVV